MNLTIVLEGIQEDLQGLAEESRRGVHVLLSDSTNAEDPGTTGTERAVGPVDRIAASMRSKPPRPPRARAA